NGENVLAVRVRNEGRNSRWYSGSGIYRHVWLTISNSVHVGQWGVYITTPAVSTAAATINVKTNVLNEKNSLGVKLQTSVLDENNRVVAENTIPIEKIKNRSTLHEGWASQDLKISQPSLWSPESP